eukprot:scaffold67753_cov66-Cyclotella_meneghiniana.AAC.2
MNQQQQPTPAQLRLSYQQKVATFLISSSSASVSFNSSLTTPSWIGETARSLALRAVYNTVDTTCSSNNNTALPQEHYPTKNDNNQVALQLSNQWKEFVCLACGTTSPHPNDTITLRTLRRGKTRKRRSSRCHANQHRTNVLYQQRIQSCGNSTVNNTVQLAVREDIIRQHAQRQLANLHSIGDGRSRHCVVSICGYCGTAKKRKGIEIKKKSVSLEPQKKKKQRLNRHSGKAEVDSNERKANNIAADKHGKLQTNETTKKSDDEFTECNYISLPKSKKNNNKSNNTSKQVSAAGVKKPSFSFKKKQTEVIATSSPLLSGGKQKKKKKKGPSAGSKLMDFLSSLND